MFNRLLKTNPVIFLDLLKAALALGVAVGIFNISDTAQKSILGSVGTIIFILLSLFNRNQVYSQKTVEDIEGNYTRQLEAKQTYLPPSQASIQKKHSGESGLFGV